MISVELHVIGGKHSGQVISLNHKKFLIGREQDCHLRPNSELVSRHHCIFTVDDFSVRLRDLGSTNGTLVNGERIRKEVVLQAGDNVVVGSLEFDVRINDVSSSSSDTAAPSSVEDTVYAETDTLAEMPPLAPGQPLPTASDTPPVESEMLNPEAEGQPIAPPPEAPMGNGDTTVISQPMMMPGQTPYQPMAPQQMGYPPMYGNYPYPQMPGQPMPGQPMPGQPMYPQAYPGSAPGYPVQQPQIPANPEPAAATPAGDQAVSLPDPAETGAKEEIAKPAEDSGEKSETTEEASNVSAAAIIQKHMQRRPGG